MTSTTIMIAEHLLTPRLAFKCILAAIVYTLVWTIPPLFGITSYTQEPFYTSCSIDWHDRTFVGISFIAGNSNRNIS